jgi:hypothetical protein
MSFLQNAGRAETLLFLGLVAIFQVGCAESGKDKMMSDPCEVLPGKSAMQAEQDAKHKSHMIYGEVLRREGTAYVLKDPDGKEVSIETDERTEKSPINTGDHISANVDQHNHALWIRANRGTDRRTEHASADCNPT